MNKYSSINTRLINKAPRRRYDARRFMQTEDKHISIFYYNLITAAVIFLDQFTKYLAIEFLEPVGTYPIIENVLHLTYVENTGAAFGMLKDARWIFMIISSVAIVALAVYIALQYKREPYICVCLALVVGGGIGNMIDRIAYGFVVDFVDFRLINFAVFNGADSFITVGSAMLIIYFFIETIKDERAKKASGATSDTAGSADKSDEKLSTPLDNISDSDSKAVAAKGKASGDSGKKSSSGDGGAEL